jgi:hypothetical protein
MQQNRIIEKLETYENSINEGNDVINLKIIEQERVWSRRQLESKVEIKIIKVGDIIELNSVFGKVIMTIKDIQNNIVTIQFNTKSLLRINRNGTINLLSNNWTDTIKFNEGYKIEPLTTDAGITWELIFY